MAVLEPDPSFSGDARLAATDEEIAEVLEFFGCASEQECTLYSPVEGSLRLDRLKPTINGLGTLQIGSYTTRLASRRVGIYRPDGVKPGEDTSIVVMDTALGTSAAGHNQKVAEEIMGYGNTVVVKGPPRYYGPTMFSLSLTADANETHGLLRSAESLGALGSAESIKIYGESQGAMKLLGVVAVAGSYGREVSLGLAVAPCYVVNRFDLTKPLNLVGEGAHVFLGMIMAAGAHIRDTEYRGLLATFNWKDVHHHIIVPPVLVSGEAGKFLDHIDANQPLSVELFGKDRSSASHRTKATLEARFPNMTVNLTERYGHVNGILSPETTEQRRKIFSQSDEHPSFAPAA